MTDDSSGLVYAHYIGGNRPEKELTWLEVRAWQPDQGVLWIHLDGANENAL